MIGSTKTRRANKSCYFPTEEAISIIYNGTMPSDPMREFYIKCVVVEGRDEWIEMDIRLYPPEYLLDLAQALLRHRKPPMKSEELNIEDAALYCQKIVPVDNRTSKEVT